MDRRSRRKQTLGWTRLRGRLASRLSKTILEIGGRTFEYALRSTLISAGQRLVATRYDWDILGHALDETYCRWLGETRNDA